MNSHYYSENPTSSGKTTIIKTSQLGYHLTFKSQSGVFGWRKTDKGSELLLNNLVIPDESPILDLGCGYGFIGIALAKAYPNLNFILSDINKLAIQLAKENCKLNNVQRNTTVLQGNLFKPVKTKKFTTIISNPPLMAGKKVLQEIVAKSKDFLVKKGTLQVVVPKKKGLKSMQNMLKQNFGAYEVLAKRSGFWALLAENV